MLPFVNREMDFPGGLPVEGTLLADALSTGPLPAEVSLQYALEIGAAIDKAHFRGLVHGSLSPHSIVITTSGVRVLPPRHPDPQAAAYRAPEQVRGEAADARSDVFAYGAILYQLASGTRAFPWEGAALDDALLRKQPAPIPMGSPLREAMSEVIESCLEKEILVRRQRIKNAMVELKLRGSALRRSAGVAAPKPSPVTVRGAVIEFPQAAPPPPPSFPIHAVSAPTPAPVAAAPATPRLDHFLVTEMPPPAPPEQWWQRLGNAVAALPLSSYDWRFWAGGATVLALLVANAVGAAGFFRHRPLEPAVRFTVAPPEQSSYAAMPVVSPDGRYLVFSAFSPGGRQMLWLRTFDARVSSTIPGTEGAMHPFWSPDSQAVAFFSGKALKRASIHGGEPQVICPADVDAGGGSWNRAGKILFAPNRRDGLFVVPAEGGRPAAVLRIGEQSPELSFLWPQFLPDGRHFLFFVLTNKESSTGVYTGTLDSDEHFLTLPSETNAVFSSLPGDTSRRHGHLLFIRGRALMRQGFDSKTLGLAGDATMVADDVGAVQSQLLAPVSVSDNGTLTYQTTAISQQLVWLDRSGSSVKRVDPPGAWGPPRISPDGARAVASRRNEDQTADVWMIQRDGRVDRLTSGDGHKSAPLWSPDGSRIGYVILNPRTGANELAVQHASANAQPVTLLRNSFAKHPTDWSADGRLLLFNSNSSDVSTQEDVWAIHTDGTASGPVLQTVSTEGYGAISPDGNWLAFHSDESGRFEVYVQAFRHVPGDIPRRWRISRGGGALPRWRGDGKELYYMTAGGRLMAVRVAPVGSEFLSEPPQALFQTPAIPRVLNHYDVSRDGERFLLNLPLESPAFAPFTVVTNWTHQ